MSQLGCELAGQVAAVTGASRGIGRAIALELAAAGARLVLVARSQPGLAETAAAIAAEGGEALCLPGDVACLSAHERLVEQAWAWQGRLDVWINNAGADVLTGEAASWSFDRKLEALWEVDVRATLSLARLVGRRMRAAGSGCILNMGWDRAEHGMEGESGELFAAVKGAVMAFTRSLARSLAPQVRVNCLAPGWIRTAWGEQASAYWQERACRESLLQRWGTPCDVARVARFLASPAAAFITGQVIAVNGGLRQT
jgi:3-oxoacyl-[acyl-carrier protein] reductase